MDNCYLDQKTTRDIDHQVARILRDLGNPTPPLRLEHVRELQKLHRAYYSSTDDSVLKEAVHRLHIAGKQLVLRPGLLLDVVTKKLGLRALYLFDSKRILIDSTLPKIKHRWVEAHEIGHSIIPWHPAMTQGDSRRTLSPTCHQRLEAEANYAAGKLLFLGGDLETRVLSGEISFKAIQSLGKTFDNTLTMTLWHAVECLTIPAFGLVSKHPRAEESSDSPVVRYLVGSKAFHEQYGVCTGELIYSIIRRRCFGKRGPIGSGAFTLTNGRGEDHIFSWETFWNGHDALTLGTWLKPASVAVAVGV